MRVVSNRVEDCTATLAEEVLRCGLRDNAMNWIDGAVDMSSALCAKAFDHLLNGAEEGPGDQPNDLYCFWPNAVLQKHHRNAA